MLIETCHAHTILYSNKFNMKWLSMKRWYVQIFKKIINIQDSINWLIFPDVKCVAASRIIDCLCVKINTKSNQQFLMIKSVIFIRSVPKLLIFKLL